ncbi:hypothetical protein [Kangiella sp. TOML190]|uniref:hypothetical protein n=1 Tax=Kangiella sp. TOML190 TaxID=2931351 RepID=UPI00203F1BF6|nr:hypothetical protein [Kangiella sp. TOML190]
MKRVLTGLAVLLALPSLATLAVNAEKPLLISDISSENLYSQQQIVAQISMAKRVSQNQLSSLQQEFLMLEQIKNLDAKNLNSQDLEVLAQACRHQPMAYKLHDEGPLTVAIFDVASLAKAKVETYNIHQQYLEISELKQQNPSIFMQRFLVLQGAIEEKAKLKMVPQLSKAEARDVSGQLLATRNVADPLLIAATHQAQDKALYQAVLSQLVDAKAHSLLNSALRNLPAFEQEDLLKTVIQENPYLASQALSEYAKLPGQLRHNALLLETLGDETLGAAAAYAIGKTQDGELQQQLVQLVTGKSAARAQVAHALLALRVADSDYAKRQLRQFVENNQIPFADMQQEVARWVK